MTYVSLSLFQYSKAESAAVYTDVRDLKSTVTQMDDKVQKIDIESRMLNDGVTHLKHDVSFIEKKISEETQKWVETWIQSSTTQELNYLFSFDHLIQYQSHFQKNSTNLPSPKSSRDSDGEKRDRECWDRSKAIAYLRTTQVPSTVSLRSSL